MSAPKTIWTDAHSDNARNVCLDGSILAVASHYQAFIRRLSDGVLVHQLGGHAYYVNDVALANGRLATASYDHSSLLFNASTGVQGLRFGNQVVSAAALTSVDPAVYGLKVETVDLNAMFLAQGLWNGEVRVWDIADNSSPRYQFQMPGPVRCVRFHADGRLLVCGSASATLPTGQKTEKGFVAVIEDYFYVHQFHAPTSAFAHERVCKDACWTDEGHVVSVGEDRVAKEWDANGAFLLSSPQVDGGLECVGAGLAGRLAVGGGTYNLFLLSLALNVATTFDVGALVESCLWTPDDKLLYSLSDGRVVLAYPEADTIVIAPPPPPPQIQKEHKK